MGQKGVGRKKSVGRKKFWEGKSGAIEKCWEEKVLGERKCRKSCDEKVLGGKKCLEKTV